MAEKDPFEGMSSNEIHKVFEKLFGIKLDPEHWGNGGQPDPVNVNDICEDLERHRLYHVMGQHCPCDPEGLYMDHKKAMDQINASIPGKLAKPGWHEALKKWKK